MATVQIGGETYDIPPFTFKQLKASWPLINNVSKKKDAADSLDGLEDLFGIVVIGLSRTDNPFTIEELEEKLMAAEIPMLEKTLGQIMEDAGLVKVGADGKIITGEAEAQATESPSTETSTDLSQPLSPPVAPVGIGI
jgi:hypothetical protein